MNKERFAQAVLAQKEKFYRIAYSYVKNEQDALDIVSEAMIGTNMASGQTPRIIPICCG